MGISNTLRLIKSYPAIVFFSIFTHLVFKYEPALEDTGSGNKDQNDPEATKKTPKENAAP